MKKWWSRLNIQRWDKDKQLRKEKRNVKRLDKNSSQSQIVWEIYLLELLEDQSSYTVFHSFINWLVWGIKKLYDIFFATLFIYLFIYYNCLQPKKTWHIANSRIEAYILFIKTSKTILQISWGDLNKVNKLFPQL